MEQKIWQAMAEASPKDYTGDTVFICPVCNRGLHMCNRTASESMHHICPACHIPLIYPWETDEGSST